MPNIAAPNTSPNKITPIKNVASRSPSLGHPDLPLRLDPVDDQLRKGVAVALQHQHVAVAGDTESQKGVRAYNRHK